MTNPVPGSSKEKRSRNLNADKSEKQKVNHSEEEVVESTGITRNSHQRTTRKSKTSPNIRQKVDGNKVKKVVAKSNPSVGTRRTRREPVLLTQTSSVGKEATKKKQEVDNIRTLSKSDKRTRSKTVSVQEEDNEPKIRVKQDKIGCRTRSSKNVPEESYQIGSKLISVPVKHQATTHSRRGKLYQEVDYEQKSLKQNMEEAEKKVVKAKLKNAGKKDQKAKKSDPKTEEESQLRKTQSDKRKFDLKQTDKNLSRQLKGKETKEYQSQRIKSTNKVTFNTKVIEENQQVTRSRCRNSFQKQLEKNKSQKEPLLNHSSQISKLEPHTKKLVLRKTPQVNMADIKIVVDKKTPELIVKLGRFDLEPSKPFNKDSKTERKPLGVKTLRQREFKNYAESSLESSKVESPLTSVNDRKVPVYNRLTEQKVEKNIQEDLYAFDSDSEKCKKKRRRRLNKPSNSKYDKIIENIVNKVSKRIKKKNTDVPVKPSDVKKDVKSRQSVNTSDPKVPQEVDQNQDVIQASEKSPEVEDEDNNNELNFSSSDDISLHFNFDKEKSSERKSKIHIISDVELHPGRQFVIASPEKFKRPNANSTMLRRTYSPWRFNQVNVTRNPHFITLKESALPCLHQDMVLDHTFVDKFDGVSKVTQKRLKKENQLSPVQKTMHDYFEGGDKENIPENQQLSLFDNDDFSPIKICNKSTDNNGIEKVKRKVLGDITEDNVIVNRVYVSTPLHQRPELPDSDTSLIKKPTEKNNDNTYFGFISDGEEEGDIAKTPQKNKENKPFRLSINVYDKKYKRKKVNKPIERAPSVASTDVGDEEGKNDDLSDHEANEVRLFDDLDATKPDKVEELKRIKRTRKPRWLKDDDLSNKKRKDGMTKEEEKAFEQWATSFNSMCEEVEQFPLEVE